MRNKYLILAASAAMVLAACSDDINQGGNNLKPTTSEKLELKSLSASSQAGRVVLPGETRGKKADRLKLVAKIRPVVDDDAINKNWSATGIAISGGNAYVSWHSNHQATVAAQNWGGAIDMIDINALVANSGDVITGTLVSQAVKFNNIVAGDGVFYLPLTSYTNGATVGRWTRGSLAMDTIALPGSSANAVEVRGNELYAVTGYAGGLFRVNADFNAEGVENVVDTLAGVSADFGGKYIAGNYYLRTNDEQSEIVNLNGQVRNTGAPLLSAEKYAEAYDPANGQWYPLTGETARHYGKHTMAVDGNYIYVGGGQGSNGENGLRVYSATGLVWQNGTNTTAVCVDENYVYAATGAGLRVYEKYDSNKDSLPLFAFEVLDYDNEGNAADHEGDNKPAAGTDAQSSNFVAVDEVSGLIFVACGQSGVYVFKLDTTVEIEKKETGFKTSTGINETEEWEEDQTGSLKVPAKPADPEGKVFVEWKDPETGTTYTPGDEVPFTAGKVIVLEPVYNDITYTVTFDPANGSTTTSQDVASGNKPEYPADPVKEGFDFDGWTVNGEKINPETYTVTGEVTITASWKEHVYKYILKLDSNRAGATLNGETLPLEIKSDDASIAIPNVDPVRGQDVFKGWSTENDPYLALEPEKLMQKGASVEFTEEGTIIVYALWLDYVQGEGGQGGDTENETPGTSGGSGEGGASDSGAGS